MPRSAPRSARADPARKYWFWRARRNSTAAETPVTPEAPEVDLTDLSKYVKALAKNFAELPEAQKKEVVDFLNALDDHDDVHRVYAAIR